jgi:site-specific DNA recombinase
MRVAIYARYSTNMQSAASIEDQVRVCRDYAKRQGWTVMETYSDAAISGASILRSGLQAALASARHGDFEILLAEALDRISRDQEDVAAIYKRLNFAGVIPFTLSEGEVGPLHVGLKGTMNALFLKDLADKTRRGMRGKVEGGRAVAGLSYGYRVAGVGERAVNEAEAAIVRRIFREYASGASPRVIARTLNAEAISGPRGRAWGPLTLVGQKNVGNGILNNELYIGRMVWNRQRWVKDPDTRKRLSRRNPPDQWIRVDVPSLRIIDDELWDAAKARQKNIDAKPFSRRARPKHLLSGLVKCGHCGGGMLNVGDDRLGCTNARDRGTCNSRQTVKRHEVEERILAALRRQLVQPELFKEFCDTFTQEVNRLRMERRSTERAAVLELDRVTRDLDTCIDAILRGVPPLIACANAWRSLRRADRYSKRR